MIREIPGFPGYQATDDGIIIGRHGKPMKPKTDRYGYHQVCLYINGKPRERTVHSLIASTFIGKRPEGMEVDHINYVRTDNRIENLRYITPLENKARSRHNTFGTHPIGGCGERYISRHKGSYVVQIHRIDYSCFVYAKTLEDAIRKRDEILERINNSATN